MTINKKFKTTNEAILKRQLIQIKQIMRIHKGELQLGNL